MKRNAPRQRALDHESWVWSAGFSAASVFCLISENRAWASLRRDLSFASVISRRSVSLSSQHPSKNVRGASMAVTMSVGRTVMQRHWRDAADVSNGSRAHHAAVDGRGSPTLCSNPSRHKARTRRNALKRSRSFGGSPMRNIGEMSGAARVLQEEICATAAMFTSRVTSYNINYETCAPATG